ncbi:MAG: BMC domain-containing protein, partial [Candidatus Eisenbacteria bacterium]|nr:BMC domain-containing protein [Candidatus Eisenbacteria bacterium]
HAADAMAKRAPIALLKAGTIQPGHYLVLIGGSVGSVSEAFETGRAIEHERLLDQVLLPDVHAEVHDAALGAQRALEQEALGVLETASVAALLEAADAAVKGTPVHIAELRLGDGLGGRAFVLFDGIVADVEAALEIGAARIDAERVRHRAILGRLDDSVRAALASGTRFAGCALQAPAGAEAPGEASGRRWNEE